MNRKKWVELLVLVLILIIIHFLGVSNLWAFTLGFFVGIVSEMIDAKVRK